MSRATGFPIPDSSYYASRIGILESGNPSPLSLAMNAIYLVSLLNRWTGESSPVRAFASKQAADRFIQSAKDEAARVESIPDDSPEIHAAWDAFETAFGCLAIQADELSTRSIEFDRSPA